MLMKIVGRVESCDEIEANIKHLQKKIGADSRTYRVPSKYVFVSFPEETDEDELQRRRYQTQTDRRSLVHLLSLLQGVGRMYKKFVKRGSAAKYFSVLRHVAVIFVMYMQEMIPSDLLWVRYMGTMGTSHGTLQRNFVILRRAQTHRSLDSRPQRLSSQTRTPFSWASHDMFDRVESTAI